MDNDTTLAALKDVVQSFVKIEIGINFIMQKIYLLESSPRLRS